MCARYRSLLKPTTLVPASELWEVLVGADLTLLKKLYRCVVIAMPWMSPHCFLLFNLYIPTGSFQLFPWCQTYILSKETADRTTCCFLSVALPVFLSFFLLCWGFLKSAGREPGAHHFNAVQNGICIIICKPYVRETAQLWISGGQERESSSG